MDIITGVMIEPGIRCCVVVKRRYFGNTSTITRLYPDKAGLPLSVADGISLLQSQKIHEAYQ